MRTLSVTAAVAVLIMAMVTSALADLPPGGTFTDDDNSIFELEIDALAESGITRGCNPPVNDLYCPDREVSRGEMAAFLFRALGGT